MRNDPVNVFILVSKKGMFLRRALRRGRAGHTWTNNLKKAYTYPSLTEARKSVMEFALKYPYDEYDSKTLEGAWFRAITLEPTYDRYEVFDRSMTPTAIDSCGESDSQSDGN